MAAVVHDYLPRTFSTVTLNTESQTVRNKQLAPIIYEVERNAPEYGWCSEVRIKWDANKMAKITKYTIKASPLFYRDYVDPATSPACQYLVFDGNARDWYGDMEISSGYAWLYEKGRPYQVTVVAETGSGTTGEAVASIDLGGRGTTGYENTDFNCPYIWLGAQTESSIGAGEEIVLATDNGVAEGDVRNGTMDYTSANATFDTSTLRITSNVSDDWVFTVDGTPGAFSLIRKKTGIALGYGTYGLTYNTPCTFAMTPAYPSSGTSIQWLITITDSPRTFLMAHQQMQDFRLEYDAYEDEWGMKYPQIYRKSHFRL